MKKYVHKHKLSYTILYYIPAHNYVGITNNPTRRMYKHQHDNNFNIDGWLIIGKYINRADAIATEFRLHRLGYNG
jgi:predicted GIY-YIG superfamily endonuclease